MLPLATVASLLLDPLVALWLADLQADHAPATIARYRGILARFLAWSAAAEQQPLTLADLTPIGL